MNREEIVLKAREIKPPSVKAAREYQDKSPRIVVELNSIMEDRPDLEKLIGKNNKAMMRDNHNNHAQFMSALFLDYNPEVLVDTVLWVFRAYQSHGFSLIYWPAQLNAWMELLKQHLLPESFEQIRPIYEFLIVNQASFAALSGGRQASE